MRLLDTEGSIEMELYPEQAFQNSQEFSQPFGYDGVRHHNVSKVVPDFVGGGTTSDARKRQGFRKWHAVAERF